VMARRGKHHARLYLLLDAAGEPFDVHLSEADAWADAVGPRFRPFESCRVRVYEPAELLRPKRVKG
jgi:hypothetical protein